MNSPVTAVHPRSAGPSRPWPTRNPDRRTGPLLVAAGESALVVAIGAALGVVVTLPPPAGLASGLSQSTSSDVSLHLNSGAITTAVIGTLLAAVPAGIGVTAKTVRRRAV
ncbi:hypothetical protein OG520_41415 (plasmid) [Streptomyces sp. NBC_00984]|uniref:hypothetical protein n=1 Tax=Streptomyces sp. NBC_00984 TaxID=2903700 RepID=UPI002F9123F5|nr:hypothetical protein OG520_41415 [Streptomyces sp. NBC_00984]